MGRPLLALLLAALAPAQSVLCIGDSITAGSGLAPEHHWHRLLGERLGPGATTRALGVGGATMLRGTDRPLVATRAWQEAVDAPVDVAVVMLGTNDSVMSSRRCWAEVSHLEEDVEFLLDQIAERFGAPHVLLCSPPPMFPGKAGLKPERAADLQERAPRLRELARRYRDLALDRPGVEFVDLARVLGEGQVTDGVHLTPFGAEAIAGRVATVLRTNSEDWSLDLAQLEPRAGDYHGFRRLDLKLPGGAACIVVQPNSTLKGRPWLWRARFFDHQSELDLTLLDLGFHLVYVDVANLYGAQPAMERWRRPMGCSQEQASAPSRYCSASRAGGCRCSSSPHATQAASAPSSWTMRSATFAPGQVGAAASARTGTGRGSSSPTGSPRPKPGRTDTLPSGVSGPWPQPRSPSMS